MAIRTTSDQGRLWNLFPPRDRDISLLVYGYCLPARFVARLLGWPRSRLRRRLAAMKRTTSNLLITDAVKHARGNDLYLLKLKFFHGMSYRSIAARAGLAGPRGGTSEKAIRRRIRTLLIPKEGEK